MSQLPLVAEQAYDFWLSFGAIQPYAFTADDCPIEAPQPSFFSAHPHHKLGAVLPDGCAVFTATVPEGNAALAKLMPQIITSQPCSWEIDGAVTYLVAMAGGIEEFKRAIMPAGVGLKLPGEHVRLPSTHAWTVNAHVTNWQQLATVTAERLYTVTGSPVQASGQVNPLARYSLRGRGGELEAQAVKAEPLLGRLALSGQATVWFAAPNSGKTLIGLKLVLDAINDGRIDPDSVFYVDADSASEGLATKAKLLEDAGAHVLAPGYRGFNPKDLIKHLQVMGRTKAGKPALIIIDTLKKVTSPMDKAAVSEFTQACRLATQRGATILGFAHVNKNSGADGKPQFGGTSDILDDFDAAYIMYSLPGETAAGEKVVRFENKKRRGSNVGAIAYAYATEEDIGYSELLASVRQVDEAELDAFTPEMTAPAMDLLPIIKACIIERDFAKMALVREVAKRSGVSERKAERVINQYTGNDTAQHHWHFERKAHGAQIFCLNENGEAQAA